ncbi:hypothetical protein D9M71_200390 [compost metagenome]
MALGEQTAGRVGDNLATVGVVAVENELLGAADRAEAQGFVGQQFIVGEAVVHLGDADVARVDTGLLVDFLGRALGHVEADDFDHRTGFEGNRAVGGHRLGEDHYVSAQAVLLGEGFGADDRGSGATGGRARHQTGHHARPDHLVVHHVFGGDDLAEHRQRVVGSVAAGLGADGGDGRQLGAVLLHVLLTSATEHGQRHRHAGCTSGDLVGEVDELVHRARTVFPLVLQSTRLHLLEAQGDGALDGAAFHGLASQVQSAGAGGAVVVDVDHRNAGHADFVQGRLAAGGVAVDVADVSLLDQVIVQAGILQSQTGSFSAHLDVGAAGPRLDEGDHANTGNVRFLRHLVLH